MAESRHPTLRDADELRRLYWEEGLSTHEIGERVGCSNPTVLRWLEKHGIERRDPWDHDRGPDELRDADELRRLYWEEGLSTYEIGERVDRHSTTVRYWLEKHGIERRARWADNVPDELRDAAELRRLYWEEGLTEAEIGERVDRHKTTVSYWLKKHDIERRDPWDHDRGPDELRDADELRRLYWEEGLTAYEIGERVGRCCTTVLHWMEKHGIPRRRHRIPDEALIYDLRVGAEYLGHSPRLQEYRIAGTHSELTLLKRFGSWEAALEAADLPPPGEDVDLIPADIEVPDCVLEDESEAATETGERGDA